MERIQHSKDRLFPVFFNRHSRTKSPAVGRCIENNRNYLSLKRALIQRVIDLQHHLDVEDVDWRTSESDARNAILDMEFYVLVGLWH